MTLYRYHALLPRSLITIVAHRHRALFGAWRSHLRGWYTETISVAEEENFGVLAGCALVGLDPLAPSSAAPHGLHKSERAAFHIGTVVASHDGLDGLGGLVCVVEGDGGNVVVEDVGLDDAVHQRAADETKLAVNGGGGAASEVPRITSVVGKRWVGVLEVCNGD